MLKIVIRLDLKVASVRTFQIWKFLVQGYLRNPYTTNLLFLDDQSKIYELIGANVQIIPFEFDFYNLYSNHVILLHSCVLHFARIPGI
jgi:hypothetical protein